MTLIAAFASPTVGFFGISDVLINHRWSGEPPAVDLPLRPPGFRYRVGDRVISGMDQKTIIMCRTLVQWAGDREVARKVITAIHELTGGGEQFIEPDHLFKKSGIPQETLKDVRILYHFNPDDLRIGKWQWLCISEKIGDAELWYEGTGVRDYFWKTEVTLPDGRPPPETLLGEAFGRAMGHLSTEAASNRGFDEKFGGWLEFSYKTSGSFAKRPYAIKLWKVNNKREVVGFGPLVFCWYVDHDLVICRFDFVRNEVKPHIFTVPDFLGRSPQGDVTTDLVYDPDVIGHFVANVDTGNVRALVTFKANDEGFRASVHPENGFHLTMTPEFMRFLHDGPDITYNAMIDNTPD